MLSASLVQTDSETQYIYTIPESELIAGRSYQITASIKTSAGGVWFTSSMTVLQKAGTNDILLPELP